MSENKVRISKKNTLYIPKNIAQKVGIKEGSFVKIWAENSRIIIEPIYDPFTLALKGAKFAKISFEDFEHESENMQKVLNNEA